MRSCYAPAGLTSRSTVTSKLSEAASTLTMLDIAQILDGA